MASALARSAAAFCAAFLACSCSRSRRFSAAVLARSSSLSAAAFSRSAFLCAAGLAALLLHHTGSPAALRHFFAGGSVAPSLLVGATVLSVSCAAASGVGWRSAVQLPGQLSSKQLLSSKTLHEPLSSGRNW